MMKKLLITIFFLSSITTIEVSGLTTPVLVKTTTFLIRGCWFFNHSETSFTYVDMETEEGESPSIQSTSTNKIDLGIVAWQSKHFDYGYGKVKKNGNVQLIDIVE